MCVPCKVGTKAAKIEMFRTFLWRRRWFNSSVNPVEPDRQTDWPIQDRLFKSSNFSFSHDQTEHTRSPINTTCPPIPLHHKQIRELVGSTFTFLFLSNFIWTDGSRESERADVGGLHLLRAHAAVHGARQACGPCGDGAGDRRKGDWSGDRLPANVCGTVRHLFRPLIGASVPDEWAKPLKADKPLAVT